MLDPLSWILIGVAVLIILWMMSWYRIVDPSQAHLVVTPRKKFVASPDEKVGDTKTYFAVPSWLPFVGRAIRIVDVTIKELLITQETIEKNQARYSVQSSTKYRIKDVRTASETFVSNADLQEQLKEVVRASVRAVTVKYDVVDARANKQKMGEEIKVEMEDDLKKWGLELINFQLVEFKDVEKDGKVISSIISDISKRREVEIEATTREQNAEKIKQARMKEAEAEEKAREREIAKEKIIGEREENKKQAIAEQQKLAEEKRFAVVQVQTIKQAEIDKEKAIVKANQDKETEAIMKEQKLLQGQGDRARAEEIAKGDAAPILEKGLAEAKAKEALQAALNKFGDAAIRALVAEKVVEMQRAVGIEGAKALSYADMKIFAGSDDGKGFDVGKAIAAINVANDNAAAAAINRIARPNDLGLSALGLESLKEQSSAPTNDFKKPKAEKPEKPARPKKD